MQLPTLKQPDCCTFDLSAWLLRHGLLSRHAACLTLSRTFHPGRCSKLSRHTLLKGRHRMAAQQVRSMAHSAASTPDLAPRNIWCVGRNYAEHIKEFDNQNSAPTEAPMIFLKAGSSMLSSGQKLVLPTWSSNVHHEVELAIELDEQLQPARAAVALDLTARDVQAKLRQLQWPWTLAKSFPQSTPIGTPFSVQGLDLQQLELHLEVNGKTRQSDSTSLMMFKIPVLLDYIRKHFPVVPGDVVLTGTPAGVSALKPGDIVVARVLSGSQVLSSGNWEVATGENS